MRETGDLFGENVKAIRPIPAQHDYATAVQRVLDNNGEELLWVAEVITGSRHAGERSLSEAVALAEAAQYVGEEWMLSWIKRLLVLNVKPAAARAE